ncbi:MAG: VOC family protein [Bacteroidetes bacterium]|nr:VOC family protein [Bacteroidota bacterium]
MSLQLNSVHHIAIICADYEVSFNFYTKILGFEARNVYFREDRNSMKCDLFLNNNYVLELFSFPDPPSRPTQPEACGLRHLAFSVSNISEAHQFLLSAGCAPEEIRTDEYTGKQFFFISDPDKLPIEFYEI